MVQLPAPRPAPQRFVGPPDLPPKMHSHGCPTCGGDILCWAACFSIDEHLWGEKTSGEVCNCMLGGILGSNTDDPLSARPDVKAKLLVARLVDEAILRGVSEEHIEAVLGHGAIADELKATVREANDNFARIRSHALYGGAFEVSVDRESDVLNTQEISFRVELK